jgi:hypothetical protein
MKHDIIPGTLRGKPLELAFSALTLYELFGIGKSIADDTATPSSLMLSGAVLGGSKYLYLAAKHRSPIRQALILARNNPTIARSVLRETQSSLRQQTRDYIIHNRQNELASFVESGGGVAGRQALKNKLQERAAQVVANPEVTETLMQRWNIPSENSGFNILEGLPEGGLAELFRKSTSAFGSKVDRLKRISQLMGMSLDEVRASKAFHEALGRGKVIQELGKGSFGKVELLETELAGQKLFFARKTSTRGTREDIIAEARMRYTKERQFMGKFSNLPEEEIAKRAHAKSFGFMREKVKEQSFIREAAKMEQAGHEGIIPTAYRSRFDVLEMEAAGHIDELGQFHPAETFRKAFGSHMPSAEMKQALESGAVDPRRMVGQIERQAFESKKRGIVNTDIHDEQFLMSPKQGDIWWVDWGLGSTKRMNPNIFDEKQVFQVHVLNEIQKEGSNVAVAIQNWRSRSAALSSSLDDYAEMMLGEARGQAASPKSPQLMLPKTAPRVRKALLKVQQAEVQKSAQADMWRNGTSAGRRHNNSYDRRIRRSRNPNDVR